MARARRLVQRRGIACEEVIKISVAIIDENRAIDNLTGLGMPTPLLNSGLLAAALLAIVQAGALLALAAWRLDGRTDRLTV